MLLLLMQVSLYRVDSELGFDAVTKVHPSGTRYDVTIVTELYLIDSTSNGIEPIYIGRQKLHF